MMAEFISELAYQVLDSMSAVIVCGGFKHSNEKPNAVSTDVAALRGAERYAKEHKVNKVNLKNCYEAWIPDPGLDSREDVKGVVRMSEADGITVRVMTGRTPLGRRLAMVGDVDIVVTIYGRQHTEVVVERGLDLGLPVLPIPDAGGDSEELLHKYRPLIAKSFAPGELDRCLSKISEAIKDRPDLAARAVIELIQSAKIGRCLVLLPFDEEHNDLYASTIEPAVTRHMIALRLDRLPSSEAIYTNFADAIQTSSAVIADITILNENVMYEIGYSHGRGLKPLIFTRNEARLTQLPVYFRTLNVRLASDSQPVDTLIEDYLCFVKSARRLNELSR
jgi:hypothetical protein